MENKEYKKKLIKNGTFKEYRESRFNHKKNGNYDLIDSDLYFHVANGEQFKKEELKACQQMYKARKEQVAKIRKHYIYWLNNDYDIFFLTFTYDDKKRRKEMKAPTLKRYCISAMSEFDDYIINVDYGNQGERLHYHALGAIKKGKKLEYTKIKRQKKDNKWKTGLKMVNNSLLDYERKVGFYDCEICKDNEESAKKLSRYIDKLTLHSVKVKQSYCSVKKGSEYQNYQRYNNNVKEDYKDLLKKHRGIFVNDYLKTHRKHKNLLRVDKRVEIEYKLLDERRNYEEFIKLRQLKRINEHRKVFASNV